MEKQYFDYEPALVNNEGNQVLICFDVEHTTEERPQMGSEETMEVEVYKAYAVRVGQPITRSRIVDAIVTAKYPADVMQAVINNYLLEPDDPERKAEFEEMQAWRAHAKAVAKEVEDEMEAE